MPEIVEQTTVIYRLLAELRSQVDENRECIRSTRILARLVHCSVSGILPNLELLKDAGILIYESRGTQGMWIKLLPAAFADKVTLPLAVKQSVRRGKTTKRLVISHSVPSLVDELERLSKLHQQGALTNDEFIAAKAKLLY